MDDRLKDLALKLKALADRGVGGEKVNAEKKLLELLKKHGLELSDLEDVKRTDHWFVVPRVHWLVFAHVVYKVCGRDTVIHRSVSKITKKCVPCSAVEFIEISALFPIYKKAFSKEYQVFVTAFILKNDLGVTGGSSKPLSVEESIKLHNMMNGIDKTPVFKAMIENK